jgi:hypothetical protein
LYFRLPDVTVRVDFALLVFADEDLPPPHPHPHPLLLLPPLEPPHPQDPPLPPPHPQEPPHLHEQGSLISG